MEVEEAIRKRRSTRKYTDQQVSEEDVRKIVNAAQLAPIAGADYSMSHITVVRDQALLDEIREACMMHKKDGTPVDPLYGVKTLILLSATGPSDDYIEYCNVACAIENMTIEATSLGLGSVYLWGYLKKLRKHPEVIAKLNLPAGYTILSSIGIGYAADPFVERQPEEKIGVDWIG
ncbi:MAG: nitroreductase family protein [Coriobacteriales bacterium]|jgi:nitroreductase